MADPKGVWYIVLFSGGIVCMLPPILGTNCFPAVFLSNVEKPEKYEDLESKKFSEHIQDLLPNVLFPTPVEPRRTILVSGRVSIVHPHLASRAFPPPMRRAAQTREAS